MKAFVLINTDKDTKLICDKLKALPEIKQIYMLFGEWDIIAMAELGSAEDLGQFVIDKIRTLPGVRSTLTQIVAQAILK